MHAANQLNVHIGADCDGLGTAETHTLYCYVLDTPVLNVRPRRPYNGCIVAHMNPAHVGIDSQHIEPRDPASGSLNLKKESLASQFHLLASAPVSDGLHQGWQMPATSS